MDENSLNLFCSSCQQKARKGKFCCECGNLLIPGFYGEISSVADVAKPQPTGIEAKPAEQHSRQNRDLQGLPGLVPIAQETEEPLITNKESKFENEIICKVQDEKIPEPKVIQEKILRRSEDWSKPKETPQPEVEKKQPGNDEEDKPVGKGNGAEMENIDTSAHMDDEQKEKDIELSELADNDESKDSLTTSSDGESDDETDVEEEKPQRNSPYSRSSRRRRRGKRNRNRKSGRKKTKSMETKDSIIDEAKPTRKERREMNKEKKKQWEEENLQQKEQKKLPELVTTQNSKDDKESNINMLDYIDLEEPENDKDEINVHFYLILPKQFSYLLKDHDLAIVFAFKGWDPNQRSLLRESQNITAGHKLFHVIVNIRKRVLHNDQPYKYVLIPKKKRCHLTQKDVIWEYLYANDGDYNRLLHLKGENVFRGTLYQVDDIFIPPPESNLWKEIRKFFKDLVNMSWDDKNAQISNTRCEVFEALLELCNSSQLPLGIAQNLMFKKSLCHGFYKSRMINTYHQRLFVKLPHGNGCHMKILESVTGQLSNSALILTDEKAKEQDRINAVITTLGHVLYLKECQEFWRFDLNFVKTLFNGLSLSLFGDVSANIQNILIKEFGSYRRYIIDSLIGTFTTVVTCHYQKSWIDWCHPLILIHILHQEFNGFPHDLSSSSFGLHGLLKANLRCSLQVLFENLKPLEKAFDVDPMLEISLLFLMELEHVTLVLNSGYFTLEYFLKMLSHRITDITWNLHQDFSSIMSEVFAQITSSFNDREEKVGNLKDLCNQLHGLISMIIKLGRIDECSKINRRMVFSCCLQSFLKCCKLIGSLCKSDEEKQMGVKVISERSVIFVKTLVELLKRFRGWSYLHEDDIHMELQVLDMIIEMATIFKEIDGFDQEKLHLVVEKFLEENTEELYRKNVEKFLKIYGDLDLYNASTNNVFRINCENFLKDLFSGKGSGEKAFMPVIQYLEKGDSTFLKTVSQQWDNDQDEEETLLSLLKSPVMIEIIKHFYDRPPAAIEQVTRNTEQSIQYYHQLILQEEITIHSMEMIYPHQDKFLELLSRFVPDIESKEHKQLLNQSYKKLDQFKRLKDDLKYLVEGQGDLTKLIKSVKRISKLLDKDTSDLQLNALEQFFSIKAPMLPYLAAFRQHSLFGSHLFLVFFNEFRSQPKDVIKEMTLQNLFQTAIRDLFGFNKDLIKEDVSTQVIPEFFKNTSKVLEELTAINLFLGDVGIVDRQVGCQQLKKLALKIEIVLKSMECDKVAVNLTEIRKQLGLTGNFEQLQEIKFKTRQDEMKLQDIDQEYINFVENLYRSKTELATVHEMILTNIDLIIWLKSILKDKSEIQTSVDFMKNAAGDRHREIELVKFFEEICSVLTPLIDLTNDAGFIEFQQACEGINRQMGYNTADKMLDVNNNLDWFRDAEKAGKSFATGAFMETKEANRNGKYIIGHIDETADRFLTKTATLDSAMSFEITNQKDGKRKVLNLTAIDELQSKLMLLGHANSSKDENDESEDREKQYFLKCADLARRLASVYVSLCEAGDANYFDWHFAFRCHIESSIDSFDEVEHEIEKLSQRLDKWKTELGEHRDKYPLMNMFNNKQCLVLRKYLFPLTQSNKNLQYLPPKVFTLLQLLNPKVCTKHIENAFFESYVKEADTSKDWQTVTSPNETMDGEQEETNFILFSKSEIESKMEELIETHDFDEDVVKASFVNVVPFVMKDAIKWCRLNKDKDNIYDFSEAFDDEIEKMYCPNDASEEEIEEGYDEIQTDEARYLELEQFGRFLSRLNKPGPPRILPDNLKRNNPTNDKRLLLILHQNEVLKSMAQIYLASGGLPHPKDILLCNDVIDEEKIELFIKLVALNQCGDVYCIAFADYLPYDLTECLLENLKKYNDLIHEGSNHLIIICTEENENQSNLRDAFEKSRVENFILSDQIVQVEIGKILKSGQMNFASAVDDDKCSARVILSERGGMGKSLYVKNKERELEEVINKSPPCRERRSKCHKNNVVVTIPIHNVEVSVEDVVDQLCAFEDHIENVFPRIYHFDIAPLVSRGLDNFIFNVVILGYLQTQTGKAWHKQQSDLCIFEITETANKKDLFKDYLQKLLPTTICKTPQEVIAMFNRREDTSNIYLELLFDKPYQRVYQYLHYYHANGQNLTDMVYVEQEVNRNVHQLLTLFLSSCGIRDPSWLELQNFVLFFNTQLEDFETNYFASANEDFPGFKTFVLKFLLRMSKDFATRSLHDNEAAGEHMVELRKHWETEYHPYLFFNEQKDSFSFIGFKVVPNRNREGSMSLIEPESNRLIEDNVMSLELFERLQCNMINDIQHLQTDPYQMRDVDKLNLMGRVLGIYEVANPDSTYELTPDNMKKIFAIHMRLRCGIPVILMGETGCGKTRLIKYMCDLRVGASRIRNMVLIKVHGGVTALDIEEKIKRTKIIAKENMINYILYARGYDYKDENLPIEVRQNIEEEVKDHIKNKTKIRDEELLRTILFLDEANTSEAIGLIKEIMIDGTLNGKALNFDRYCIDVIAACNPYRRHSDVMIKRLESAGLGYHVTAEQSYEKFGDIPLRHLVYRVHPLPESMKPLVWDFGSLSNEVEFKYSRQIIDRCVGNEQLPRNDNFKDVLLTVLTKSQEYMRSKKNECSFVSLRDIERGVSVTSWFYRKMDLFSKFIVEDLQEDPTRYQIATEKLRKSLLLAVAVCYIAKLDERAEFIEYLKEFFTGPFALEDDVADIEKEIERFQKMFIDHLDLKDNIAKNKALCENLFMMVVCIELRIPLFIIGKPGSSKSLAKTIIQDNMQGNASRSPFFKKFKRINMTSYQCSPHSTSEGIIGVFNQAAKFQEQKNLDEYTSVVVLDEVGLAEDSPKLPLKALHPLLEDGTDGSEDLTIDGSEAKHKRVSFVGISNWGLDPAKMNRGILLSRSLPDKKELAKTAREICTGNEDIKSKISPIMEPLAGAYFELYRTQKNTPKLKKLQKEEFFGLRDFYCLVKMVFCFAKAYEGMPPLQQIELAVKRNFSGLEELNAWDFFRPKLLHLYQEDERPAQETPTLEMIQSSIRTTCPCLRSKGLETKCTSSRYLLIMTENYSALPMVEAMLQQNGVEPDVIFGSSFPRDQEFTQVCRDINRMKIAMETGKTIILLNMEKLYESLYDALNQYYVFLGGQSYVDLGLGTHRVKCRVDEKFRLIVVANKQVVYELFPIPLINRLEKHFLMMTSGLVGEQQEISNQLKEWATNFSRVKSESEKYFTPSDAFIGFTEDTCPSIVMQLYQEDSQNVFEDGKRVLINIATPDSIFRLGKSRLQDEKDEILSIYFDQQQHTSLTEFLNVFWESSSSNMDGKAINHFIQVTTFSRLMSQPEEVSDSLNHRISVKILDIVKYPTEFDFRKDLETSLKENGDDPCVIIVQHTETDKIDRDVVACAQHICRETQRKFNCHNTFFLFLVQLNTSLKSSVGYHSSWICTHIDDIRNNNFSFMRQCQQPLSSLFQPPVSDTMLATVKNSIQSAMKQFNNEKNMDLDKVSRKIMLIQQRIGSNDELSLAFIEVTMQYMQNMIESQESFMVNASNWMLGEAIKEQNRLNYATFQASLVSCIETKVANIWAQFLNLIDINDNLLLLEMDDYQEIWMTLMKIVMGESKGLENVDEVPNAPASSRMVKNQHGGGIVSYGFPFSSYIVKDVESKLKASQELNNDKEWDMELLDEALTQSPYSEVFEELSEEQIDNFTKDLMMLKYPDLSEDAYKVLQMGIDMGLKKIRNDRDAKKAYGDDEDEDDDYDEITEIFFVVCFYKTQFDNAAKMLSCSPEIAKKVISTMKRQDTEEMVLELQLLKGLLTSFQPTNEQAKKREVSLAGNNTMKEIKYLVEEIFLNYSGMKNIDKPSQQLLEKSRLIWTQLRILQLYEISVRHFSIEEENESSFEQETVFEFWKVLRDMKNGMKETRAWDQIEKFLQNVLNENEQRQPPRSKSLKTSFKKNCAQFFVDIVEEFCFSKHNNDTNTQQNEEVLKKIMRYTFTSRGDQTREFSPIADEADNSPVIRSFILQQLMKREVEVDTYFDQYLRDNMQFAQDDEDKWNMCKLFVNCYEDNQSAELASQRGNKFITEEYITQLSQFLNTSIQQLTINWNVHEISASLLKDVARARVAITHSCGLLSKLYIGDHEIKDADKDILRTFFPLLMRFCQEGCKNTEMHLFILKQIVFEHGYRELDYVIEISEYDWLNMERENTDPANNTGNDRFLVYGIAYKEIRDQMAKEALQRNLNADLEPVAVVDELTTSLALLHESVFANYQPEPEQLNQMMNRYQANALQETIANLQPCQLERDIVEMLYHFSLFLNEVSNGVGMLRLLYLLARQPDACQGWYLPTMPSDNFQEIFNTNRRRGRHDGLNQFVPYQCPNGHVYVITECGRAMTNRPCPECGANIGGRDHTLDQQNRRVDGQRNNTLAGYSCGSHQQRPQFAAPERQLKPLNNLLQRLLINLSMLLGCFESNPNSILALIHQAPDHDVVGFFVNHLRLDFRLLREVLGKNNEDIMLLIHLFIRHLKTLNLNHLDQQGATVTQLPQPNGRNQFENDFDLIFVQSFVQSYNNDLEGTKRMCLDDLQVGADPLIRRLYEIDENRETPTSDFDVMKATQLWRYRQPLSINHMRMKLQEKFTQNGGEEFRQLYRFLNEEKYYAKSVKELPKLVEFYKLLHLRYKYQIDKKKAKEITIGDFLKDLSKEKGNKELYKKLQQTSKVMFRVWNQLSEDLKEHGPFKPDANFHPEKLDSKTKLEYFLVSTEGAGRCLQSLIRFLQYIQNDFLILYQQLPGAFIKVVDINVLKESEVIRYTAEEDLLPILYLHCDYSLAIGQGTKIEYNFQEIERRFMEKVCYGKCMIERTLEPFKYRDNVQSSREFINMRKKVPQTEIAYEEQRKMLDELKHIDDLSNTLKAVETAIGFLSTHGGTPNQKYDEYLDTKLRYNPKHYLASKTMKKLLRLTHLCSAWLMLTVERAIRIHNNGQNPFTFDATIFTEPLEGKLLEEAKSSFAKFDKKTMTSHLTEYMVLELPDKDANYDTYELWEALDNYMADKNEMLGDQKKAVLPYSEFIPEEIQLKHVYAYWGLLVGAQSKR